MATETSRRCKRCFKTIVLDSRLPFCDACMEEVLGGKRGAQAAKRIASRLEAAIIERARLRAESAERELETTRLMLHAATQINERMTEEIMTLRARLQERVGLNDAMCEKLIRLCHPDRHANSELSNEVTRWLLAQRKKK
jgi:hypothetical protein